MDRVIGPRTTRQSDHVAEDQAALWPAPPGWFRVDTTRSPAGRPRVLEAARRQYTPDFYYPDPNDGHGAWHEHWGSTQLHRDRGTDLIETTWAGIMDRSDFRRLAAELDQRGITRRWDPTRPTVGGGVTAPPTPGPRW